ncbi:MAG TPA: amino acid adenylation domain-containing protein, partial [Thermoanaerobaculia bacterium]|nr:amino acid adenylation domain-containing protein [Thermoanaerobaculia bacterium]
MKRDLVEDLYPLSPTQQGMLFHTLLRPGGGEYVVQLSCILRGDLDPVAFRRAWAKVIERHSCLRSVFLWERREEPLQLVYRRVSLPWREEDWSELSEAARRAALADLLREDRVRGFDVTSPPLLRMAILGWGEGTHAFVWSGHHLLLDGWSFSRVLAEVFMLYRAYRRGEEAVLPASPPFSAYIAWHRRQDLGAAEAFWRRTLAGLSAPTPLGVDRRAPDDKGTGADENVDAEQGWCRGALDAATTQRLQAIARRQRLTLGTLVQGAWALLLSRYSGADDVLFGLTVAGRPAELPDVESMVGLFIATLPERLAVPPAAGLLPWLGDLQARSAEMLRHQHASLAQIQGWSEVPRGTPLFESLLVFENYPVEAALDELGRELVVEDLQTTERTNYPLHVVVVPGARLQFKVSFDRQRFTDPVVHRLAGHLETLLAAMGSSPERRLAELPLLGEVERHQLLWEGNDTESLPHGEPATVHGRFAAQARRTPAAVAVACGKESWSYGEIDARANRLADLLRRMGVGPDVRVGLCAEPSVEMVVGVLGVLKSGGAYVPLDPQSPPARLEWQLADSGAALVLAAEGLENLLPAQGPIVVPLGAGWEADESATAPEERAAEENLVYVIYTSGSTGQPKGVMVPHRGVAAYLRWACRQYGLSPGRGAFLHTGLAFDLTVTSLLGPLMSGGAVTVAGGEGVSGLVRAMARGGRGLVKLTPSHLPVLSAALAAALGEDWEARCADLAEVLVVGGEALSGASLGVWRRHAPELWVANEYGPTEASVGCCVWMGPAGSIGEGEVPIGRPIAGARLYVVDRAFRLVVAGVEGELLIGGGGLARGYLGDPQRSAERFVPDPFGDEPGGRLYRTGDRVRRGETGELVFVGRVDDQIKIRGHRVEPAEVEAALLRHPTIAEAAVVAREDVPGDRRLVAYVVGQEREPEAAELRDFLSRSLPAWLLPSAYVATAALPRTASGKVSRRALAALPAPEREAREEGFVAPRTPVEELLAGIWEEVLRVERVGVGDSFFDLGGHSLLATQVLSRVQESLGVEVPIHHLFERPTLAALAEEVAARAAETWAGEIGKAPPPLLAQPRIEGEHPPLSFSQERLWLLDQLDPGDLSYNLPAAVRMRGRLDVAALAASLSEVVRRHAVLRTRFAVSAERPVQVIAPAARPALPVIDLEGLPAARRVEEAERLSATVIWQPFDLAVGPLFRAVLLRLAVEEHVALLVQHHIVSDGWSVAVMVREVGELMRALARGEPPLLPALPVQYADFAAWQRQWLAGDVLAEEVAHWRRELDAAPEVLELPWDRPRPAGEWRGPNGMLPVSLGEGLGRRLRALCRREGVTLYMALLAAWAALLGRHSGADDLLVGSPVANRTRMETEGLIGFFVNLLVLRADLAGDPAGSELLARVRKRALAAYAHQDLPFARLVAELRPQRSLAHTPLFQVLLTLQNAPGIPLELPGLTVESLALPIAPPTARYDLSLTLAEGPAGLRGMLEYRRDLCDPTTAARLLAHLEALLAGLVADPRSRLSQLSLLTAPEAAQLLVEWNDGVLEDRCLRDWTPVQESIAAQAARTPEALALLAEPRCLTYRELERESNRLANYLRSLGAGPETLVAIGLERSVEVVVAMLAILKTGGAYLPLDPDDPHDRVDRLLADSRAPIVITRAALACRFESTLRPRRVVRVDDEGDFIAAQSCAPPNVPVAPEQLAYLLFTSGSTGRPKGVLIPHRALSSFAAAAGDRYGFARGDRMLQFASLAFDASVLEIYPCLLAGGAVVLRGALPSFTELMQLCRSRELTVLSLPAAYWHQMAADLPLELPHSVRLVFVSGEEMRGDRLKRWRQGAGAGRRTVNGYGPTETTVFATSREVAELALPAGGWRQVPIGRPLANTRAHVLDRHLRPVPIGVAGELYLGGEGLARGYHERPEATAAVFLPDPFASGPGRRLYRTGDRIRRLADGDLVFLGRIDRQIKLRGFRVELEEVEVALAAHPDVVEAVVLAVPEPDGEGRRLAAYVTAGRRAPSASDLRSFLERRLPSYMLPAFCVVLDELPRTASGKIDRRSLATQALPLSSHGSAAPPGDDLEELLALLWSELLGVESIGAADSFFDLGGHSLLVTQMVARLRDRFAVELSPAAVFETPSLAGVTAAVRAARRGPSIAAPALAAAAPPPLIPLSFAQQRFWLLDQMQPGDPANNLLRAFRLTGELEVAALAASFREMVRRHEVLRTRYPAAADGAPVQEILRAEPPPLPLVDLSGLQEVARENELRRCAQAAARCPFDLAAEPPLRVSLLRLAEGEHALLWTVHHIASDGWSVGIELKEVATLYRAFASGQPSLLAELPIQYRDYAIWQRRWLTGQPLADLLDHWRAGLGGPLSELKMRGRRPRPATGSAGAIQPVRLGRALTAEARVLGRREGATLFIVLLAAWQTLLYLASGQPDQRVGTPIAGRTRSETEDLVGCFLNTLVLRSVLGAELTFRQVVRRLRQVAVAAYAHQDLPFELLQASLGATNGGTAAPLFEVWFVLQNAPSPPVALPGLEIRPLAVDGGTSRFDLALNLGEGEDGVGGQIEYRTGLFHRATIAELAADFVQLLSEATADPDLELAALGERLAAARGGRLEQADERLAAGLRHPRGG